MTSKVLSRLLLKVEREGKFQGISIRKGDLTISHLIFADDLILFCNTKEKEVRSIRSALRCT